MRSPYDPSPHAVDYRLLRLWNHANQRAREEYAAHPIASCAYADCEHLARVGAICDSHLRSPAADRARKRRAA